MQLVILVPKSHESPQWAVLSLAFFPGFAFSTLNSLMDQLRVLYEKEVEQTLVKCLEEVAENAPASHRAVNAMWDRLLHHQTTACNCHRVVVVDRACGWLSGNDRGNFGGGFPCL
ncbi:hypothetical protein Ancab_033282 [Ancistrocladus abbreviatus]